MVSWFSDHNYLSTELIQDCKFRHLNHCLNPLLEWKALDQVIRTSFAGKLLLKKYIFNNKKKMTQVQMKLCSFFFVKFVPDVIPQNISSLTPKGLFPKKRLVRRWQIFDNAHPRPTCVLWLKGCQNWIQFLVAEFASRYIFWRHALVLRALNRREGMLETRHTPRADLHTFTPTPEKRKKNYPPKNSVSCHPRMSRHREPTHVASLRVRRLICNGERTVSLLFQIYSAMEVDAPAGIKWCKNKTKADSTYQVYLTSFFAKLTMRRIRQ